MSFYDLDINQNAVDLLPPDKRYNKIVAFITALLSPLQWLHDMIFNSYYIGSTAAAYAPGTWNKYQQVIYRNSVYESLIDGTGELGVGPLLYYKTKYGWGVYVDAFSLKVVPPSGELGIFFGQTLIPVENE